MASPFEDLDELTLRCRDEKARGHISEAVASYRAGAFRAAIVTTWIAVCFDVIEKLRELTLAGDKEAEQLVQSIEKTHRTNDITAALKFEKDLLSLAKDKFSLLTQIEYEDLKRLQDDRNRCAHPSLSSDEQAYTPPAELARLHIHSAVVHLLQHPPVQGKFAHERILKEIDSEYFPISALEAKVVISAGPLKRPRDSLLRGIVVVLYKELLKIQNSVKRSSQLAAALQAIEMIHPAQTLQIKGEKLSSLFRNLSDNELYAATEFLEFVPNTWQFLAEDIRLRLQGYVENLSVADIDRIEFLLSYQPLKEAAISRLQHVSRNELRTVVRHSLSLPVEIVDRLIDLYLQSSSFDQANLQGRDMLQFADNISEDQIRRMLNGMSQNAQLMGSYQLAPLIARLRESEKLSVDEFERLLLENGLEAYNLANNAEAME